MGFYSEKLKDKFRCKWINDCLYEFSCMFDI